MMKSKKMIGLLIIITLLNIFIYYSIPVKAEESDEFNDEMVCEEESIWTDDQWQFYNVIVDVKETIIVELEYEGDLDLDLRLYWKRDNGVTFNGFDITHCDINSKTYKYNEFSELRTENTEEAGFPEELEINNPSYTKEEDQIAYILVFVYEGEGKSAYTLTSSKKLTLIEDNDVYDCNFMIFVLIIYILAALVVIVILSLYVYRKKAKITGKKEEKKLQKEQEKKEKAIKHFDLETKV